MIKFRLKIVIAGGILVILTVAFIGLSRDEVRNGPRLSQSLPSSVSSHPETALIVEKMTDTLKQLPEQVKKPIFKPEALEKLHRKAAQVGYVPADKLNPPSMQARLPEIPAMHEPLAPGKVAAMHTSAEDAVNGDRPARE